MKKYSVNTFVCHIWSFVIDIQLRVTVVMIKFHFVQFTCHLCQLS